MLKNTWLKIRRFFWWLRIPGPTDYIRDSGFWFLPKEARRRRYRIDEAEWRSKEPK